MSDSGAICNLVVRSSDATGLHVVRVHGWVVEVQDGYVKVQSTVVVLRV